MFQSLPVHASVTIYTVLYVNLAAQLLRTFFNYLFSTAAFRLQLGWIRRKKCWRGFKFRIIWYGAFLHFAWEYWSDVWIPCQCGNRVWKRTMLDKTTHYCERRHRSRINYNGLSITIYDYVPTISIIVSRLRVQEFMCATTINMNGIVCDLCRLFWPLALDYIAVQMNHVVSKIIKSL